MLKAMKRLISADKLVTEIERLEAENARLKSENSRLMMTPTFEQVSVAVPIDGDIKGQVMRAAVESLKPLVKRELIDVLEVVESRLSHSNQSGSPFRVNMARELVHDVLRVRVDIPSTVVDVEIPFLDIGRRYG